MGRSEFMYVNAENIITLDVYQLDDCGILGGGKYVLFSDSDSILEKYNLLYDITARLREEATGTQKKILDSKTFARLALRDPMSDPYLCIADSAKHKKFGYLRKAYFDASERLYTREDGDGYSAFLYTPPNDSKDMYIFGEDVNLNEFECSGKDIAEIIKELFPDKAELADCLYEDDEINTFKDASYTLDEYLSRSEMTVVRNALLGVYGSEGHQTYIESSMFLESLTFRIILDRTSNPVRENVGLLLDKSLLILDYDKLVPPPRPVKNIKFVTT